MTYCTEADVTRMLSVDGVVAFSDNGGDGLKDADVIADCIAQAAAEIDFELHERYSSDQLVTSAIVNRWATTLACYFLCIRRGNLVPESIQRESERILFSDDAILGEIRRGNRWLPGLEPNRGQAPSFANVTIDRRFRRPQKVFWDSEQYNSAKRGPRAY
jgi:phage gp36-like protein